MILKDSLSRSSYTVKNSWEFQNNIVKKTTPDGYVMVSLDAVAMFSNIQFTHEMQRNSRISFLDLEIIKPDNSKIVSNWYRKSTYSGRLLNFI